MRRKLFLGLLTVLLAGPAFGQSKDALRQRGWDAGQVRAWLDAQTTRPFRAASADCPDFTDRRDVILNGNKITTQIFNFGSISAPGNTITDIVWNGLGYGYEFGPFISAEILDPNRTDPQSVPRRDAAGNVVIDPATNDTVWVMHIVSDGLVSNGGEISPDGSQFWGWQPIPCAQPVGAFEGLQVVNPNSDKIPTNDAQDTDLDGKPDSWPDEWYNENLGRYVWPGALQQGASNSDKEGLYFMNDGNNCEFSYDPFPSDPDRNCGLGLEVEVRMYQWANPLAEDAIFLIYKITNKSEKDLDNVIFGMWGDPHIGGPANWQDDLAFFDRELNMVYAWDDDKRSDVAGQEPGYFGYKFLESPGLGTETIDGQTFPGDGIDNDNDGLVDESWTDGIDNDGDWNPELHDVGQDGIPGTGDLGEGDGVPTAGSLFDITKPGEPNFEFTDIDESDMIGLTSFASPPFAGNRISNDDRVWQTVQPGNFDEVPTEPGDYVFLYASGPLGLRAGETKRFSIGLIVGESLEDLLLNAETVQQIYDVGYRFARPPDKPHVRAVPGDKKVTLYWDARAENSVDPLTNEQDFEGYVIYRSTDSEFSDQQNITDINGTAFLYTPLKTVRGVEAKFDLKNGLTGPSPVPFPRRGVAYDLGDDTGLFHTFVDSNNVINGQQYFYTVVAYDRGFLGDAGELGFAGGIPPSETNKTITYDPTTDTYIFDVNTVTVTPRPTVAGYVPPVIEGGVGHPAGAGTGEVNIKIVDPLAVEDGNTYRVTFDRIDDRLAYTIIDEKPVEVTLTNAAGKATSLGFSNIVPESFVLRTAAGQTLQPGQDYELNPATGSVFVQSNVGGEVIATFTYMPVRNSTLLASEEGNPLFDGLHVFLDDDALGVDSVETGWVQGGDGLGFEVGLASAGPRPFTLLPADYEVRFSNTTESTSLGNNLALPFSVVNLTRAQQKIDLFTPDLDRDGVWDVGEPIIFIEDVNGSQVGTWQVQLVGGPDASAPGAGAVLFLATNKPFSTSDTFTFTTRAAGTDAQLVQQEMRDIYVVPNPYVATNVFEPNNPIARTQRGERRLYFANVPQRCTIRIYTLAGELVDVVEHESTIDDGKAFWDLRTKDNMNIAYGLYLFHVESDEGTFTGKFAVIK